MISVGLFAQSIIINPDGTHSVLIDYGVHKVIVNPDGTLSILAKQGNFQQVLICPNSEYQPIIIKKRGDKIVILPDGSVINFEKVKKKRMEKTRKPSRFLKPRRLIETLFQILEF